MPNRTQSCSNCVLPCGNNCDYPCQANNNSTTKCVSCTQYLVCNNCLLCRYCAFKRQLCKCCAKPLIAIPHIDQINERFAKLERKIQKLKYSPGNYGYLKAENDFSVMARSSTAKNIVTESSC